ncbi:Deoxyribonuclease gamma (DNase gamma) (DNase I homolog protein DHP2) (Deoxyribonuclease I-like 3) (DNase I-like 3) (Liver and spleen DNase) (LS-DNase) (LSD) [Durusdinium trenchii]|uniref:Deoxyribonuclease gamma (DNase gamma) (DNase I homolog protein DHP2) (Deoxyribonuclease I-like 3) (DNase I-like 3) (Liver and spleen DNase) (LS-DNase) (LSD) n=1 Tax=Durusdinium trenchii TaxID=1381693 RepID=A0ABP0L0X3_9DINO
MLPFCWLLPTLAAVSAASEQVLTEAPSCDGVFFATFNIQNYGVSKASKPAVLDALAATIHRYDVVTIQEISQLPDDTGVCGDHTESAICDLQAAVNAQGRSFSLAISPRIGDEQYAVMYDSSKALFLEGATYPDNSSVYSRPPYAFHLQVGGSSMVIASTHTSPSSASSEIAQYPSVISWMEATFTADYYMVAGDYNADGSYFDEDSDWTAIMNSIPSYSLLTGNEMDTTLALSSNTYDRIIVSSAMEASGCAVYKLEDHLNLSGVLAEGCAQDYISSDICSSSTVEWHEVAKELSDHYPVELCMHLNGSCTDCVAFTTVAPQQLGADSCARVGFHADNPDDFGLLFLEALAPQSSVYVTDGGCSASGVLREGEGLLQFQASEELPAGSVLSLENFSSVSGTFSLSISGDQILVFSGSKDNPTYMCAINFDGSGWASGAESASTSALPPGLTGFALPETDNAAYVGSTTGTVQELLQWIHLEENWRSDNSEAVPIPRSFTVVTTTTSTASGTTTNTATTTGSHTHTVSTQTSTSSTTTTATTATTTTTTSGTGTGDIEPSGTATSQVTASTMASTTSTSWTTISASKRSSTMPSTTTEFDSTTTSSRTSSNTTTSCTATTSLTAISLKFPRISSSTTVTQTTTSTGNRLYQSVGYVAVSASTDACRVRWYLPCAIAVLVA